MNLLDSVFDRMDDEKSIEKVSGDAMRGLNSY